MPTTIRCGACSRTFQAPATHPATCPNCGTVSRPVRIIVPSPGDADQTRQTGAVVQPGAPPDTKQAIPTIIRCNACDFEYQEFPAAAFPATCPKCGKVHRPVRMTRPKSRKNDA